MLRITIYTIFFMLTSYSVSAQTRTIYAEVFGQGLNGSLNFDKKINLDRRVHNSYSLGVVFVPKAEGFGDGAYFGIPVSYNYIFGKKSHHLELGIGFTVQLVDYAGNGRTGFPDIMYTYINPKISYRYQPAGGGLFFRLTATSFVGIYNQGFREIRNAEFFNNAAGLGYPVFPWPGASIGWTLRK